MRAITSQTTLPSRTTILMQQEAFVLPVSNVRGRTKHLRRMHAYHRGGERTHGHVGHGRGGNGRAKGLYGHRGL
jgi:hypothetical protein